MRVVVTWRTKTRDEDLVNLLSEESWVPEDQTALLVVAKGRELLESLPPEVRELAEPQLKAVLYDKATEAWGIVTGETKNQRVFRFRHNDASTLREVAEKVVPVLENSGLGHFDERDPIQILEHGSQSVTLWGRWIAGGWGRALREKRSEAWLAGLMLLLTAVLVLATWPRTLPQLGTLEGYREHWLSDSIGRVLTATLVTFVVAALQIVFHYWENARHRGIRWSHGMSNQGL